MHSSKHMHMRIIYLLIWFHAHLFIHIWSATIEYLDKLINWKFSAAYLTNRTFNLIPTHKYAYTVIITITPIISIHAAHAITYGHFWFRIAIFMRMWFMNTFAYVYLPAIGIWRCLLFRVFVLFLYSKYTPYYCIFLCSRPWSWWYRN